MKQVQLENSKVVLQVNLSGGAYSDFHLKENPLNPINWKTVNPEEPPFMGHFLCLDRRGPPSEAEKANGFRHHGEVTIEDWELSPIRLGRPEGWPFYWFPRPVDILSFFKWPFPSNSGDSY